MFRGCLGGPCSQLAGHPAQHRRQRSGQLGRVRAPSHGHVGLAAALAADLAGHKVDQLTRLDLARGVCRLHGFKVVSVIEDALPKPQSAYILEGSQKDLTFDRSAAHVSFCDSGV